MEKEFNHRSGQAREERKDEDAPQGPNTTATPKHEEENRVTNSLVRRKRIRAYQRIDYWQ